MMAASFWSHGRKRLKVFRITRKILLYFCLVISSFQSIFFLCLIHAHEIHLGPYCPYSQSYQRKHEQNKMLVKSSPAYETNVSRVLFYSHLLIRPCFSSCVFMNTRIHQLLVIPQIAFTFTVSFTFLHLKNICLLSKVQNQGKNQQNNAQNPTTKRP